MTNSLLRSGCPDDFLTLGENGQAVFDSALQIRETLRLRKQQAVADALAIPQMNDSGSRVDWYAPHPGKVTSWAAASEEQRSAALRYLEHCVASVNLLSTQCQRSEKTALRLFGSLLAKALQFPGSQYLYLIDDKPVITFWGFVNQNETARDDVLACLHLREPRETYSAPAPRPAEPAPVPEKPIEPLVTPQATPNVSDIAAAYALEAKEEAAPQPIEHTATFIKSPTSRRHVASALAFVVLIALVGSWYIYVQPSQEASLVTETDIATPGVTEPTPTVAVADIKIPDSTLPLMRAAVVPPAVVAPEPVARTEPPVKGALVLPPEALKIGSTKFLNGAWQVRIKFKDPIAGKPPTLRYRIANNKGTVRLFNSDNVVCKADIYSGIHQSGTIMIKSRSSARCEDGSRHVLPEISCKSGINGIAECIGRFEGDNLVPVTFQKVSN